MEGLERSIPNPFLSRSPCPPLRQVALKVGSSVVFGDTFLAAFR